MNSTENCLSHRLWDYGTVRLNIVKRAEVKEVETTSTLFASMSNSKSKEL